MTDIKLAYVLLFGLPLAFALGWFSRGDVIYGAMYQRDINNIGTLLPVDKGIKK